MARVFKGDMEAFGDAKEFPIVATGWNDLTEEIGVNVGVFDNPHDLTPNTWTLMRFTEWENPQSGNLEWLICKHGCMYCEDPGCLTACTAPGAIGRYSNDAVRRAAAAVRAGARGELIEISGSFRLRRAVLPLAGSDPQGLTPGSNAGCGMGSDPQGLTPNAEAAP